ncbi:MAG: TetR family transcriptional regulator [Solirubrobacterales bacterium]|nr:TetR family transcriptional regulator [Solirubrobacterales bacterium]
MAARAPRGEARRAHILEATLRVIAATGPEALTHRRVAQEAGLPLAATTYWFASKEELVAEAYRLAADRDVERAERLAEALGGGTEPLGAEVLAARLAALTAGELDGDRASLVAGYALCLEAARRPELREIAVGWTDAYRRLAARLLELAGSTRPVADAELLVAVLDGLLLEQLARGAADFGPAVLQPALERLVAALLAPAAS